MGYSLPPEKRNEFCDRLEKAVRFMADIIQVIMGLQLYLVTDSEIYQRRTMNHREIKLTECFPIDYSYLKLIGVDILSGEILVKKDMQSNIKSIKKAVIGYEVELPDGQTVNYLIEEKPAEGATIKQVLIHSRSAILLEGFIKKALRDAYIPLEPLLGFEDMPRFPALWRRDAAEAMIESQSTYMKYMDRIDKTRREVERETILNKEHVKAQKSESNCPFDIHLIMNIGDEGSIAFGDTKIGIIGNAKIGTVLWALLHVLKTNALYSEIGLDELAKLVDIALAEYNQEIENNRQNLSANNDDAVYIDTNKGFQRRSLSRPGKKPTYSSMDSKTFVDRIQAILRKNSKSREWRERWIHWKKKSIFFGISDD